MRHHANSPCRRSCAASCGMSSDSTQHTNAMFRKRHPLPKGNNPQLRLRAESLCIFRTRRDERLERLEQLSECALRTTSNDSASSYEAWRLALGCLPTTTLTLKDIKSIPSSGLNCINLVSWQSHPIYQCITGGVTTNGRPNNLY